MADRYWVGNGGNWSDNVNHWAASQGGAPNASAPTSADNVFFIGGFNAASQTVTVDVAASFLGMDWTGATNTPTLAGANNLEGYASLTLITGMTWNFTGDIILRPGAGVTSNLTLPIAIANNLYLWGAATATFVAQTDVSNVGKAVNNRGGTVNTNGKLITCATFSTQDIGTARVLTLGASVINCTVFSVDATSQTVTANTSTIKVTGTGAFAGGGITTYNNVELNGTAHTITGDNTFASLRFNPAGAQTLTFTGTTQTVGSMGRTGTGTITIVNGDFTKTGGGKVKLSNMSISGNDALPANTFYAGIGSTDGGANTNWYFRNAPNSFLKMGLTPRKVYNPRLQRITRGLR